MKGNIQVCYSRGSGVTNINDLPNDVIIRIISLLPTVDAVRTSVLAKDWKYKWASAYRIKIDYNHPTMNTRASFVNFVNRIFRLPQNIQDFSLSCRSLHGAPTDLKTWISSLSKRSSIQSINIVSPGGGRFTLPRNLLENTSLTHLRLKLRCITKVHVKDYFCNLKFLYLCKIHFVNEHHFARNDRLLLTFPVLKTLELENCTWGNVKFVEISSPSLTTFIYHSVKVVANDFLIKIRGAKLEVFTIFGGVLLDNFDLNASSIDFACILGSRRCDHPFVRTSGSISRTSIKDFSAVNTLRLLGHLTKTYAQLMPGLALPRFDKLELVHLVVCGGVEAFLEFLHMAPTLKTLLISPHPEGGHYVEDYNFHAVGSVPSCMLSHLKGIIFLRFLGTECELQLVRFMLKNSVKLERVVVRFHKKPLVPKTIIKDLVLTYPKGPACTSLEFV